MKLKEVCLGEILSIYFNKFFNKKRQFSGPIQAWLEIQKLNVSLLFPWSNLIIYYYIKTFFFRGSDKYTAIFQDLKASWKKYTDLEDGERIAAILRDNSVENEVELLSKMSENEIADLFRVKLRKVAILEEENDQLHRRNRDLSHRLHLVEHRVGKAQIVVMEKVEKATGHIIQEFHERELDLARNVEILQEENSNLTAKNEKLEETVDDLHEKVANLETSNKELTEINVDNERKISNSSDEIFSLQDLLGKTKVQLEEETEKVREKLFFKKIFLKNLIFRYCKNGRLSKIWKPNFWKSEKNRRKKSS